MINDAYKIKLANVVIQIEEPNAYLKDKCAAYFVNSETTDVYIEKPTADEIADEREIANKQRELDDQELITFENEYLEYINIYRKIVEKMPKYGVMLMHAAAIAVDNRAYLFLAKSGTGKTTHIMNWIKAVPGTIVINGDKPLIDTRNMTVCGTPWSGKENLNTNITVPLAGICILERGKTNEISQISSWDAVKSINDQTHWPADAEMRKKTLELLDKLGKTPCYKLRCTPEIDSAKKAYEKMHKN